MGGLMTPRLTRTCVCFTQSAHRQEHYGLHVVSGRMHSALLAGRCTAA